MLKILQNHYHIPIHLAIRILLLMALTGCGSPAPQSASPTLPPAPTKTALPIPSATKAVAPTSWVTPLSEVSESRAINPQNAAEVIQLVRLGQGMINGAPFYSADGQLLVIRTTIGVDLYAAATLEKLGSIPALSDGDVTLVPTYPRLVALSPDQRMLAANLNTPVYSPDGDIWEDSIGKAAIFLWDVADGTLVRKILLSSENSLADIAFSLDGQTLAVESDGVVRVIDVEKGIALQAFDQSVRHFWPANQSQIYCTLAELDELDGQGFIEKEIIPREERLDMKVYSITDSGREELHRCWLSTPLHPQDYREPALIQIYFGGKFTDEELIRLLNHEIQALEERQAIYEQFYKMNQEVIHTVQDLRASVLMVSALEYGIPSNQAALGWLRSLLERVSSGNYTLRELGYSHR